MCTFNIHCYALLCFSVHCHYRYTLHWRNTQPDQLCLLHQLPVIRCHHRRSAVLPLEETQPVPTHQGSSQQLIIHVVTRIPLTTNVVVFFNDDLLETCNRVFFRWLCWCLCATWCSGHCCWVSVCTQSRWFVALVWSSCLPVSPSTSWASTGKKNQSVSTTSLVSF